MSARAWVAIVVALGFVVGSIVWLIVSPGALPVIFLSVGVVILLISAARRLLRLTDPEVDIPDELRVGELFSMRYRQRWKRATKVSRIRFELLFQETVFYKTTDAAGHAQRTARFHDEVIQSFTVEGRRFKRGQTINQSCAFQIPLNGMHTFYASNHRIEWYITARIEMPRWRDHFWQQQLLVFPELAG